MAGERRWRRVPEPKTRERSLTMRMTFTPRSLSRPRSSRLMFLVARHHEETDREIDPSFKAKAGQGRLLRIAATSARDERRRFSRLWVGLAGSGRSRFQSTIRRPLSHRFLLRNLTNLTKRPMWSS